MVSFSSFLYCLVALVEFLLIPFRYYCQSNRNRESIERAMAMLQRMIDGHAPNVIVVHQCQVLAIRLIKYANI